MIVGFEVISGFSGLSQMKPIPLADALLWKQARTDPNILIVTTFRRRRGNSAFAFVTAVGKLAGGTKAEAMEDGDANDFVKLPDPERNRCRLLHPRITNYNRVRLGATQ